MTISVLTSGSAVMPGWVAIPGQEMPEDFLTILNRLAGGDGRSTPVIRTLGLTSCHRGEAVSQGNFVSRLAGLRDGVLLVVEAERVRWEVAQRQRDLLLQGNCTPAWGRAQ